MTYTRLEKLRARRIDPLVKVAGLNEAYERIAKEESSVQYAIGAMQPIDPGYNKITLEERQRIEDQLAKGFAAAGLGVEFDYQGSVTNDTHIRAYSDIDLLTVGKVWFGVQPPNTPTFPYKGDAVADLRALRSNATSTLKSAYPAATVDVSGAKAINITGGSLRRKIDVIACAWWHTVEYVANQQKSFLGIEILDNNKGERIPNKPFLHNKKIEDRDVAMNGGLRKLIRLLKSLKYDSDSEIKLSSYDITGIVFNMPDQQLLFRSCQDLLLVNNCNAYLNQLIQDRNLRDSIFVPNGTRKVFCPDGASVQGLEQMSAAMNTLVREIELGMTKSFRKLAEARVAY